MSSTPATPRDRRGRAYTPAIGPRLKLLLWIVLIGFALLGANGAYLASVTFLQWARDTVQQTFFSLLMIFAHLALGLLLVIPFLVFGITHLVTAWKRPGRAAINYGLLLFGLGILIIVSGFVIMRLKLPLADLTAGRLPTIELEVRDPTIRDIGYWTHVAIPLIAILAYLKHRLAGPRVKWEYARAWVGGVGLFIVAMGLLHSYDPRAEKRSSDPRYTYPSSAKLAGGKLISEQSLMMDQYCISCHKDAYDGWFHSAHHFSSFNNKAYLFAVRETREVAMKRDGNTRGARFCAGCHDPVPFFSGAFDDPDYDDVNTASSQAGITCTACHAITHVNSTRGNADYTIEEPQHYPFAYSDNPFLQWINQTLVKAKPELHKKTFLKPIHRDSKFCSACHKVNLPFALNNYQEFTRGQNHWDNFILSGAAGGGARSFYYPPVAKNECRDCHMELVDSSDFGALDFDNDGAREIHDHMFLGGNTGLPALRGRDDIVELHRKYLQDDLRVDIFALREGGRVDGNLIAPLRPTTPTLEPGKSYLLETVVRTLNVAHLFTQGTTDSNEIWVELVVKQGDQVVGRSGEIGPDGRVDPYAHFINVYMLDRHGKRVDRRNAADIFVPLYNKQIPPGAGQVVHFALDVPPDATGPLTIEAKVNYRKFDRTYMDYIFGPGQGPALPIIDLARDSLQLAVAGGPAVENPPSPIKDEWQRWNDYGIGLLLEGAVKGGQKGELRQAEEVFKKVAELGRADGWANLARVYQREGRIPDALDALKKASEHPEPAAPWVIAWLSGQINEANGFLDEAITQYRAVLGTRIPERKFNFANDYEVNNSLALALYNRGRLEAIGTKQRQTFMSQAVDTWLHTLSIDSENVAAHYGLGLAFAELSRPAAGKETVPSAPAAPAASETPDDVAAGLVAQAREITAASSWTDRVAKLRALDARVQHFLALPRPQWSSRFDPLLQVTGELATLRGAATEPDQLQALAATLATCHKALHKFFKPDETAEGRAVAIARRENPAANMNAASVVIHPLHAPGQTPATTPADAVFSRGDTIFANEEAGQ